MAFISHFINNQGQTSPDDYNQLLLVIGYHMINEPNTINIQKLGQALYDLGNKYVQIPAETIQITYSLPFKRDFSKELVKLPCQGINSSGPNKGSMCGRLTYGLYCGYHDKPNIESQVSTTTSNVLESITAQRDESTTFKLCTRILHIGNRIGLPCGKILKKGATSCGSHGDSERTLPKSVLAKRDKIQAECDQLKTLFGWTLEQVAFLCSEDLYEHKYNHDGTFNPQTSYDQIIDKINKFVVKYKSLSATYYQSVMDLRNVNSNPENTNPKSIIKDARKLRREITQDFERYNMRFRSLPLKDIELLDPNVLIQSLDEIITNQRSIIKT